MQRPSVPKIDSLWKTMEIAHKTCAGVAALSVVAHCTGLALSERKMHNLRVSWKRRVSKHAHVQLSLSWWGSVEIEQESIWCRGINQLRVVPPRLHGLAFEVTSHEPGLSGTLSKLVSGFVNGLSVEL